MACTRLHEKKIWLWIFGCQEFFKNVPHCLAALGDPEGPSIRADPKKSEEHDSKKFWKQ